MKGHIRERSPGHWAIVSTCAIRQAQRKWDRLPGAKRAPPSFGWGGRSPAVITGERIRVHREEEKSL
jgi:hypothetical protein